MDSAGTSIKRALPENVLATLAEIGEELNASLNLDKVLGKIASLVQRLMDCEILGVLLLDPQTQTLSYRFAMGYRREVVENWRINDENADFHKLGDEYPRYAEVLRAEKPVP